MSLQRDECVSFAQCEALHNCIQCVWWMMSSYAGNTNRNANCLGLCRLTVFRRNVFFEMTAVAQSSVAQKIIRPNVFRPTGFSPNRLHPIRVSVSKDWPADWTDRCRPNSHSHLQQPWHIILASRLSWGSFNAVAASYITFSASENYLKTFGPSVRPLCHLSAN